MPAAALPPNEAERLGALERYAILDSAPETGYDDLTFLASQICGTPMSLVSFVAQGRQWFKSRLGIEVAETPREVSFCAHAIHGQSVFEVPDASADPRFCDNPLVSGELHLRFYAGAPLVTPDGLALGTLCVIDQKPRHLSDTQRAALSALARQVVAQLELRSSVQQLEAAARVQQKVIEQLRQSRHELLRARHEFDRFMDNSPIIAFIKDRQGRFLYHNRLFATTFDLEPDALLGRTDYDWLPPAVADAVRANDALVMARNFTVQTLEEMPTPHDPHCQWLVFKFPIGQGEDARLGGVALDLTELRHAEKLKNEFVSIVSHELRTPLTAIRGALGLLGGEVAGTLPPRAQEMVSIAQRNVERLALLIDDLLDIEKIEGSKMRFEMAPLDLEQLLRAAAQINAPYAATLGARLQLQDWPADLQSARVRGDSNRLMQVLANLLSNAAKFTPPGGHVYLSARRIQAQEVLAAPSPTFAGNAKTETSRVRVEVRDEGEGVPAAFVPHLFERFAQADSSATRQKGGTGLGLAISRAILEKHGAGIGYLPPDSGRAGGTFFCELDLWEEGYGERELS